MDIKLTLENKQLYPAVVNLRQFSNNTDILKFEMSDYMYETTDLSKLYCYAVCDMGGEIDEVKLETEVVESKLKITWKVTGYTTQQDGHINYQIVFKNLDEEQTVLWFSYQGIVFVNSSIDADGYIAANYPSILQQWEKRMNDADFNYNQVLEEAKRQTQLAAEEVKKAEQEVTKAKEQVRIATEQAKNATSEANRASSNADKAKSEADRAETMKDAINKLIGYEPVDAIGMEVAQARGKYDLLGERLDEIGTNLEELAAEVQTQQEKITYQQTQIDTIYLGDGLASKAMVNAGYYTYKGISYGGSASNNGIDVAEIDGAYSQETTNGFQLFDASKLPTKSAGSATVTNNGDGSFTISGSGNLSGKFEQRYNYTHEDTLKLLKVGKLKLKKTNWINPVLEIGILNTSTGSWVSGKRMETTGGEQEFDITLDDLNNPNYVLMIRFRGNKDSEIKANIIKPMLYQDGDGTWEPFTGGIASPNPEYPQEPKFVGDYNEDTQKYIDFVTSGKNLLNNEANTFSFKGVTFTINKDKSILLSGTATETIYWNDGKLSANIYNDKIYTLSGCPSGGGLSKYYMYLYNESFSLNDTGNGVTNMSKVTKKVVFGIAIFSGVNVNGLVFKPQLEIGTTATDYQPYQGFETTALQLNQPLRALPNGVKDTIENCVVTRRVGEITYDGSEAWVKMNGSDSNNWLYAQNQAQNKTEGLCDLLLHKSYAVINQGAELDNVGFNTDYYKGTLYLNVGYYMEQAGLTNTVDNLKTWLQSNPITVCYELATPTTEQITLPTLPSWYPYTNAWVGTELQPSFVEWHIKTAGVNQNDLTVIKEDISQLQTETTQLNDDVTDLMGAFTSVTDLTKQLFLLMHRVGDIIFSTSDVNPSTIYGGTWVAWGKGRVPVGVDTSDSDFNTVEKTGGSKEYDLRALIGAVGGNVNTIGYDSEAVVPGYGSYDMVLDASAGAKPQGASNTTRVVKSDGNPATTVQPYITCYMWKRVS